MKGVKSVLLGALLVSMLSPLPARAANCSPVGYTVVFVNGIYGTKKGADENKQAVAERLGNSVGGEPLIVESGYNPSHLAGWGDLLESVTQAFQHPISDFDLTTILNQIHSEITTQKILLVGHSQGTFYTNELYDYLTTHGVPKSAIAVYNIATPASYVAGGGGYVTSSNDKVVNAVRDAEVNGDLKIRADSYYTLGGNAVASALRPNITLPKEPGWASDQFGGHALDLYLDGAGQRIVRDIDSELARLTAGSAASASDGCFTPPGESLAYDVQKSLFAAADTAAQAAASAADAAKSGASQFSDAAYLAIHSGLAAIGNAFGASAPAGGQISAAAAALDTLAPPARPSEPAEPPPAPSPAPSAAAAALSAPPAVASADPVRQQPPAPDVAAPPPPPAPTSAPEAVPESGAPPLTPIPSPGYGGGGGGAPSGAAPREPIASNSDAQSQEPPPQDQQGDRSEQSSSTPAVLALSVYSPAEGAALATTTVTFSGSSAAGVLVSAAMSGIIATTSADASGSWSLAFALPEGDHAVDFVARGADGNTSDAVTRDVTVDITPPDPPSLTSRACERSLSSAFCLVPEDALDVAWGGSDATSYAVVRNGEVSAPTRATSSVVTLAMDATTTIAVIAYDAAGNAATSSELALYAIAHPLVINEIGWGGTDRSSADQWIELKNTSAYALDLSHIALARTGGAPIALSGALTPAGHGDTGFLVVEPHDIAFTGMHKLITSFGPLATTSAEQLSLAWSSGSATTTIDATPGAGACGGAWCAGAAHAVLGSNVEGLRDLTTPLSMERIDASADGSLESNWQSTDSYGPWLGTGAGLWGTPGQKNSAGLPDAGVYCGSPSNIMTDASDGAFDPGSSGCEYLTKFVTGDSFGAVRYGGLFEGDVASSTKVSDHAMGKALAYDSTDRVPADTPAGTHFFFAVWENRSYGSDAHDFNFYFTQGASSTIGISGPPHGNYVVIPFTYEP